MSNSEKIPKITKSYWSETDLPAFDQLKEDLSVDVAIVGAGITGITSAYLLSKEGLRVAVIEGGSILKGTTGHTTAKITAQHGLIYDELIGHFGEEKAKLYYESQTNALRFIQQTATEKKIACDFANEDAYIYAVTKQYADKIHTEWEAYKKLGIDSDLTFKIPFDIKIDNALIMRNQGRYHPLKFLKGLLNEAVHSGCQIYENTAAMDVDDSDPIPKVITRDGHKVTCKKLIVASHFPYCDKLGLYFTRMYAERSYAIGIIAKKKYPGGMYISADNPTRSIRETPMNGESLLIIGGENHKTGQGIKTFQHYQELERFAKEIFGITEYAYRWSAQDLVTLDKVPYIGPITKDNQNILLATGYKKWGMTTGIMAGHLLTDYVLEQDNPYKELYSPSRFTADPSLRTFITTNADVAKHLLKGKLEFVPKDPSDVKNGEGSVVIHNGKRAGAYRDENGQLFLVDTSCTHLGCETEWNDAEKTWDCPCHGSRYTHFGDVIEGPAVKPLTNLSEEGN